MRQIADTIIHHWLRVPYLLYVRDKRLSKNAKTTYLLIHGLGDTGALWSDLTRQLPDGVNYVTVDLLGFGKSKKPAWATYNAAMQARSLLMTYLSLGIHGSVTVVGHSLGSLVAVEFAKRYPLSVTELILCSPPIYDSTFGRKTKMLQQDILHQLYKQVAKSPKLVMSAYALGKKLHVINQSLEVTPETVPAFMASLQASVVNQRTMKLIEKIKVPITIVDGLFDVLTINPILKTIASRHDNMKLVTIPTSHVVNALYTKHLLRVLGVARTKEKRLQRG